MGFSFLGAGLRNEQTCLRLRRLPQWLHLSVTPSIACRLPFPPKSNSDLGGNDEAKYSLGLFCLFALMTLPVVARAAEGFSPPSRTFLFTYQVTLKDIPAGARRVRVWIPCAVTDANQTVVLKKVDGPVHLRETQEAAFGNHILYGEILHPQPGPAEFTVEYR